MYLRDMKYSKYCIIRFVLDQAYEDHAASVNPDWTNWLTSLSRMFRHKIPEALLQGLLRKQNPEIEQFCLDRLGKINQDRSHRNIRYLQWIERRDLGNCVAHKERQHQHRLDMEANLNIQKQAQEIHLEDELHKWEIQQAMCLFTL